MPAAIFVCPYKTGTVNGVQYRYCAMDDFTSQIRADAQFTVRPWDETEILGNQAIVLVRAANATLNTIAAAPGFRRIPVAALDTPLSSLTGPQRTALRDIAVNDCGYPLAELQEALGDLSTVTLRDFLRFLARRRRKPRTVNGVIQVDGAVVTPSDPVTLEV
jgi:hypothetical protein